MISIRFFNNIRYKFSLLLDQKSKNKFIHIILLSIASAFLELIGVSLLLYTILSIFEPNFIQDYQLTKDIYDKLQLRNEQRFVLVLSAFLFLIYIFKNVVLVYISKRQIQLSFEINAQISDDNYKQLMQSQLNYFRSRDSSSILNEMMSVTMNLSESIHTPIGELGNQISGGQRQRIAIARALYKDSEIFLFDEVTNNLDDESKEQVLKTIQSLKKVGKTALFVTHNETELSLCNSVYNIKNQEFVKIK